MVWELGQDFTLDRAFPKVSFFRLKITLENTNYSSL
jgi:hypothetical protein